MKIKAGENLPLRLATLLEDLERDVDTVNDERLIGHADAPRHDHSGRAGAW
jgi:hypothetical protein